MQYVCYKFILWIMYRGKFYLYIVVSVIYVIRWSVMVFSPEDGIIVYLRNVCIRQQFRAAWQPERWFSTY
jgi:hypothetical protein